MQEDHTNALPCDSFTLPLALQYIDDDDQKALELLAISANLSCNGCVRNPQRFMKIITKETTREELKEIVRSMCPHVEQAFQLSSQLLRTPYLVTLFEHLGYTLGVYDGNMEE